MGPRRLGSLAQIQCRFGGEQGGFGQQVVLTSQMGQYALGDEPYLLYLPHCARPLYEALLGTNFSPSLARGRVLLGNDLAEYIGFVRDVVVEEDFTKVKKKRKGKGEDRRVKDGVLERLGMVKKCTISDNSPSYDG